MRRALLIALCVHELCSAPNGLPSQLVILESELAQLHNLLKPAIQVTPEQEIEKAAAEAQKTLEEIFLADMISGSKRNLIGALNELNDRISAQPEYGFSKLLQQYRSSKLRLAVVEKLADLDNFVQKALESIKGEISSNIEKAEIPSRETLSQFYSIGAYIELREKVFNERPSYATSYEELEYKLLSVVSIAEQKRLDDKVQKKKIEEEKIISAIKELTENITLTRFCEQNFI